MTRHAVLFTSLLINARGLSLYIAARACHLLRMGRLQRFFAWPGLVPAIAQVAFGTATGLFASRALLHIQNILENQRPETTVEESDEDDAVEGYDETDFDAIMQRYEQYITKASGICLTMDADHDKFWASSWSSNRKA